MKPALRAGACLALWASMGLIGSIRAQITGVTRTRIPVDPAAAELNRLLAAAQSAVEQKDYATAAKNYQEFLSKKPDDATVHYDLGYAYTALGRTDDAKSEYQKAISLDPQMGAAYLNLGLTLLPTDPKAAVEPLQHAVELIPDQAQPKFVLGTAFESCGNLAQAIAQYQAADKLDDKDFDTHFALGRAFMKAKRPAEAEPEFRSALALRPDAVEAHLGLGQSLIAQQQYEAGVTELTAYLKARPDDARIRVECAAALVDLGKYDDALAQLDRAAAQGPEDTDALELRARIYFAKKQYGNAVPPLEKAAALAPQNANFRALLGHALLENKEYTQAVSELLAANRLDPSANDVLGDLVLAEYNTKNYGTALRALEMLSQRQKLPPESWFIRGACYDKLGRLAQALDAYQKFLQLNTNENSDMYFEASSRVRALKRELQNKKR
jgi:Flp pilus assembly protein TadD